MVTRARAEAVDGAEAVVRVTTARIATVSRARFGLNALLVVRTGPRDRRRSRRERFATADVVHTMLLRFALMRTVNYFHTFTLMSRLAEMSILPAVPDTAASATTASR